jgi:hypothetical protein
MQLKCHKQIEMPQFNHMANIFLTFQEFFKILAQVATKIWKSLQLDLILKKKNPKTHATLEQGPKCCKHIKIPHSNNLAIISSNFSRILWKFGP